MEADSDEELVRRFQAGDDQAYAVFVRRHQDRISRLACVRLDARDAAQEVFLRAYRGLGRFRFGAESAKRNKGHCPGIANATDARQYPGLARVSARHVPWESHKHLQW